MDIIDLLLLVVVPYVFFSGSKFANFKSRIMNEFDRQNVRFEVAEQIFIRNRGKIKNLDRSGMPIEYLVGMFTTTAASDSASALSTPENQTCEPESRYIERIEWQAAVAADLIDDQLVLAGYIEDSEKIKLPDNDFLLGYVVGLSSAAIQRAGMQSATEEEILLGIKAVFYSIFFERGLEMFDRAIERQVEPEYVSASQVGEKDIMEWVNSGFDGNKNVPMSLREYYSE